VKDCSTGKVYNRLIWHTDNTEVLYIFRLSDQSTKVIGLPSFLVILPLVLPLISPLSERD
jgi:hypothetical protein